MRQILTTAGKWLASPWAFAAVGVYTVLWLIFDRASLNWHALATIVTLLMTLSIQRAEHRDTQAIHAKLDELLRVNEDARDNLINIDDKEPEDVEKVRKRDQA
ncbi:low affinity iron permease family protein [Bradyrhizobium jicamae]|uniref:Low affinity iron permease family protein n=1 Tax=Bradyrhizobium jicamae TaxID=280332 RepID=A0ABS5FVZ7_9BRAD|nr:low affinity iron permease family protein [Bradyrhizobium jicamae]MBR0800953.1 low affinity iron permease family protein [Bradyrhizobium jicamae]MBR0939308.1 low affinity iron permease family protein [Bradyrhizobium jicamae]